MRYSSISINQQTWLLQHGRRELPYFNDAICLRFLAKPEINALRSALDQIVERHDVLRTTFTPARCWILPAKLALTVSLTLVRLFGKRRSIPSILHKLPLYRQKIHDTASVKLTQVHIADESGSPDIPTKVKAIARRAILQPFDYNTCPMLRATLVWAGSEGQFLVIVISHLLSDGTTIDLLCKELNVLYSAYARNTLPPLTGPVTQYAEFADWQRQTYKQGGFGKALEYWVRHWEDFESCQIRRRDLPLPGSEHRPQFGDAIYERIAISRESYKNIRAFARANNVTIYMLMVAVLFVILHEYTGRSRIFVWGYTPNRVQPGVASSLGWFANPVLLGIQIETDLPLIAFLDTVRRMILKSVEMQEAPSPLVWLSFFERHGRPPEIFTDLYVSINGVRTRRTTIQNEGLERVNFGDCIRTGLEFMVVDGHEHAAIELATSELSLDAAKALLSRLAQVLDCMTTNPTQTIHSLLASYPGKGNRLPDK